MTVTAVGLLMTAIRAAVHLEAHLDGINSED
jgi:hypothetical protein